MKIDNKIDYTYAIPWTPEGMTLAEEWERNARENGLETKLDRSSTVCQTLIVTERREIEINDEME